jgi:hypothetical protein
MNWSEQCDSSLRVWRGIEEKKKMIDAGIRQRLRLNESRNIGFVALSSFVTDDGTGCRLV